MTRRTPTFRCAGRRIGGPSPPGPLPAAFLGLLLGVWGFAGGGMAAAEQPAVLDKPAPETMAELRLIEQRVRAVVEAAAPATVALEMGSAGTGSGVIVTPDGYVLTAAHVIGEPGQLIQVRLADGGVTTGRTLGGDGRMDGGMVKLDGEGPYPFVEMAEAGGLDQGDWVVALGHPGGFNADRPVVARLGRAIRIRSVGVQSDCSLIGGDSGGPLFDLEGKVVGIHSRIGRSLRSNIHVPIDFYRAAWDRLAAGQRTSPLLGVGIERHERGVRVTVVVQDSAADKAGLLVGDILTAIDDQPIIGEYMLPATVAGMAPGDALRLTVLRDDEVRDVEVTLGAMVVP